MLRTSGVSWFLAASSALALCAWYFSSRIFSLLSGRLKILTGAGGAPPGPAGTTDGVGINDGLQIDYRKSTKKAKDAAL